MDPFETVGENINDVQSQLRRLVHTLKLFPQEPSSFSEISLLTEFSNTTRFPLNKFNPRELIERMLAIHKNFTNAIIANPTYLETFIYKYSTGKVEEEYVFSNSMTFCADIITICYVFYFVVCGINIPLINHLMASLVRKYCKPHRPINFVQNMNFLEDVVLSYPSVYLSIMHYHPVKLFSSSVYSNVFPDLSNIFCIPWLASIIPVLDSDPKTPLALLLAIHVEFEFDVPCYVLYQRILAMYTSNVFPESFKLALCKKWGIVYMTENEYKYAIYFTTLRENTIDLIRSLKANDPTLECTLSKI